VVALLVVGALAAGCGDGSVSGSAGTTSTTTEVVTSTTRAPTSTPGPSAPRGDGALLTADDTVLVPPDGGRAVDVGPGDPCAALSAAGDCGAAGALVWVARTAPSAERSPVTVYAVDGGRAMPVLVVEPGAREDYGSAHVEAVDLDGRPGQELVIGLRNSGSGGLLQLEIVGGGGEVLAHATLDRGRAELDGSVLRTWAARYGPDDPNCCPSEFQQAVVSVSGGRWRSFPEQPRPAAEVPEGDFP
jgi:hypothetical protein